MEEGEISAKDSYFIRCISSAFTMNQEQYVCFVCSVETITDPALDHSTYLSLGFIGLERLPIVTC